MRRAKRRRAALDYDDLIVATRRLLESAESAAWVLYKLDGGIDHVLVDEAQDTNPDQWEVIRRLTEEFFVGEGAVERSRTMFAVGDIKQSIFGFQRADPRKLQGDARPVRRAQPPRRAAASSRSTSTSPSARPPAVLDAVDWVFGEASAARGVAEPGDVDPPAQPQGRARPGRALAAGHAPRRSRPTRPTSRPPTAQLAPPHERLARLIAVHAKGLIGKERRAAQRRAAACRPLHGAGAPAQRVRQRAGARS